MDYGETSCLTGADLNKDDGIYSAFFVSFNADGRYTVKVDTLFIWLKFDRTSVGDIVI